MAFRPEDGPGQKTCPKCGREHPSFISVCSRCNIDLNTGEPIASAEGEDAEGLPGSEGEVTPERTHGCTRSASMALLALVAFTSLIVGGFFGLDHLADTTPGRDAGPASPRGATDRPRGSGTRRTDGDGDERVDVGDEGRAETPPGQVSAIPGRSELLSVDFAAARDRVPAGASLILIGDEPAWFTDFAMTLRGVRTDGHDEISVRFYGVRGTPRVEVDLDGVHVWHAKLPEEVSHESKRIQLPAATRRRGSVDVHIEIRRGSPREHSGARGVVVYGY